MKTVLLIATTAIIFGAAQSRGPVTPDGQPIDRTAEEQCRERIELVRAEQGLPRLERGTASPEEPLFFTALDYQIDGCSALVMKHDTSDIRPMPVLPDDQPLFQPAR